MLVYSCIYSISKYWFVLYNQPTIFSQHIHEDSGMYAYICVHTCTCTWVRKRYKTGWEPLLSTYFPQNLPLHYWSAYHNTGIPAVFNIACAKQLTISLHLEAFVELPEQDSLSRIAWAGLAAPTSGPGLWSPELESRGWHSGKIGTWEILGVQGRRVEELANLMYFKRHLTHQPLCISIMIWWAWIKLFTPNNA